MMYEGSYRKRKLQDKSIYIICEIYITFSYIQIDAFILISTKSLDVDSFGYSTILTFLLFIAYSTILVEFLKDCRLEYSKDTFIF